MSKFYLSQDGVLDNLDVYLGADYVATVEAEMFRIETASFYLDNTLNIGTYYLIAQADSDASVEENNENNWALRLPKHPTDALVGKRWLSAT